MVVWPLAKVPPDSPPFEATGKDQARAGRLRLGLMTGGHRRDPVGLAGQVDIVGPGLGAGRDQVGPIELIGARSRDHHLGPTGHGRQRRGVMRVGDQYGQAGRRADQAPNLGQLVGAASRHRPFDRTRRTIVQQQILGDQATGIAGGAVDNDVELAGFAHGFASILKVWLRDRAPP